MKQIARAGRRARADVVLLTDHDTLEARRRGEEGWYGDVLLLAGVEVSPRRRNHLLAFGIDSPIDHEGLDADGICRAVTEAGGIGFAAHPWSRGSRRFKRAGEGMPFDDLESEWLHGVELWSFVTDSAEALGSLGDALRFVVAPQRLLDHPPTRNVEAWDRLCLTRPVVAIGGLDAHQIGKRVGPVVPLRLMAYKRSFRFIRTHVLCKQAPTGELEHDREQVFGALRAGRCYIAVDAIAPARGFRFEADDLDMGSEAPPGGARCGCARRSPRACGSCATGWRSPPPRRRCSTTRSRNPASTGSRRCAARTGRERTWILSNPIYLR